MKHTQITLRMLTDKQMHARSLTELPTDLLHIAVGQLLGDAHAGKSSPTSNTRLTWSFGTNYLEYAQYIANLFNNYCNTGIYSVNVKAVKGGITHTNYRLKTVTLPIFNMLDAIFYVIDPNTGKRVKIVPSNINEYMSPITLAHFIIGDGGYHSGDNIVRIFTYNFTLADCHLLAQSITNLGVETRVVYDRLAKNGDKQYVLKIGSTQLPTLRNTVMPHMHSSMYYRIGIGI